MIKPTITVTGQHAISRAFRKLGPRIGKKPIRKGARAGAKIFAAEVKKNTPVGKTRTLVKQVKVRSIKAKRGDILVGAQTGNPKQSNLNSGKGFYGGFIEYGRGPGGWHDANLPEQPFIRPAFERKKQKANRVAVDVIVAETNKEIRKL